MNISKIKKCRFCNSDKLDSVLSLGKKLTFTGLF